MCSGFNFDDDELGFHEDDKSDAKVRSLPLRRDLSSRADLTPAQRENEKYLRSFVSALDEPTSQVITASRALDLIAMPRPHITKSIKMSFPLTLGDRERFPDSSLLMHVDTANKMSMKKWSLKRYQQSSNGYPSTDKNGARGSKRVNDSDDETERDVGAAGVFKRQHADEAQSQSIFGASQIQLTSQQKPGLASATQPTSSATVPYSLGAIGESLEKMLARQGLVAGSDDEDDPHSVDTRTYWRTKPVYEGKSADELREEEEELERLSPEERRQRVKEEMAKYPLVPDEDVASAYVYGGSYVDAADMGEGAGTLSGLETGMMIVGFMRQSNVSQTAPLSEGSLTYVLPLVDSSVGIGDSTTCSIFTVPLAKWDHS
jgi:hypothetical protein